MINEKYNELLQEIARIIAVKNFEIEELQDEVNKLKKLLEQAEQKKG